MRYVSPRRGGENEAERIFEEIMVEDLQIFMKNMNLQIQNLNILQVR